MIWCIYMYIDTHNIIIKPTNVSVQLCVSIEAEAG